MGVLGGWGVDNPNPRNLVRTGSRNGVRHEVGGGSHRVRGGVHHEVGGGCRVRGAP